MKWFITTLFQTSLKKHKRNRHPNVIMRKWRGYKAVNRLKTNGWKIFKSSGSQ